MTIGANLRTTTSAAVRQNGERGHQYGPRRLRRSCAILASRFRPRNASDDGLRDIARIGIRVRDLPSRSSEPRRIMTYPATKVSTGDGTLPPHSEALSAIPLAHNGTTLLKSRGSRRVVVSFIIVALLQRRRGLHISNKNCALTHMSRLFSWCKHSFCRLRDALLPKAESDSETNRSG